MNAMIVYDCENI